MRAHETNGRQKKMGRSRHAKIMLVWPGGTRDPLLRDSIRKYIKRIEPFVGIEIIETKEKRGAGKLPPELLKKREGKKILEKLGGLDTLNIVFGEEGVQLSSCDFAARLDKWMTESGKDVAFIMGGQEGLDGECIGAARECLSLSRLTFPHELARLVLVEQIYRALTILHGKTYHR